jgi:hypothetical protein
MVTGTPGDAALATARPPVWCEGDDSQCTQGPKQMVFWQQKEGNNIEVVGFDASRQPKFPTYSTKLGFKSGRKMPFLVTVKADRVSGAQTDIFSAPGTAESSALRNLPHIFKQVMRYLTVLYFLPILV